MIDVQIKYEPGNIVWAMYDNKPLAVAVNVIRVVVGHDVSKKHIVADIKYTCDNGIDYGEEQLAATIEELKEKVFGK